MSKQSTMEVLVGMYDTRGFEEDHKIRIQKEIRRPQDSRYISLAHDSNITAKLNSIAREKILDFDSFVNENYERVRKHIEDLKLIDFEKSMDIIGERHDATDKLIKVYESVLEGGHINPMTYLAAKRHFTISKILLSKVAGIDKNTLIEEFKKQQLDDKNKEAFELGVFVGLEQLFVSSIFSPTLRDDQKAIYKYIELVNKYAYFVSQNYQEEYLEATGLRNNAYSDAVYLKFLSYV